MSFFQTLTFSAGSPQKSEIRSKIEEARNGLNALVDRVMARKYQYTDKSGPHTIEVGNRWTESPGMGSLYGVDTIPLFPGLSMVILAGATGCVLPDHSHPFLERIHVISGEVLVETDARNARLGPGGFFEVPAGITHKKTYLSDAIVALTWNEKTR